MTRVTLFNSFVVAAAAAILIYSLYLVGRGQWSKGTYFLVMAVAIFSNLIVKNKRIF